MRNQKMDLLQMSVTFTCSLQGFFLFVTFSLSALSLFLSLSLSLSLPLSPCPTSLSFSLLWIRVLLCSPGCLWTHNSPATASRGLWLQACTIMPGCKTRGHPCRLCIQWMICITRSGVFLPQWTSFHTTQLFPEHNELLIHPAGVQVHPMS
jgi:hypothetical protein